MQATGRAPLDVRARARPANDRNPQRRGPGSRPPPRRLPESGYFADVNPNSEVYSPMNMVESPDITKRSGRYQSDFIWNTDWESKMDREASLKAQRKRAAVTPPPAQSGGLGLTRLADLNDMDVDLSEQLRRRSSSAQPAARPAATARRPGEVKAFQAEGRRWDRSSRYSSRAVAMPANDSEAAAAEAAAAEERERYEALKQDLQLWTLALSGLGVTTLWVAYSREAAISYAVGAAGSLVYQRMLNRSIDAMVGGGLGGALGQPRLLIPLVLTLGYNRWNQLKAEETGLLLQLLPMLLGFFTYKAALVGRQAGTLLGELSGSAGAKQQG